MTKHLVPLALLALVIAGCRTQKPSVPASPITQLPPGSFARAWTQPLDLRNDPPRGFYATDDGVYLYSESDLAYAMARSGGALRYVTRIHVSGGILRDPIPLPDHIVFPASSSLEVYTPGGRFVRSVALPSPTGASGVGLKNIVFIGINQLRGYGRLVAMDITRDAQVPVWSVLTRGAILGRPALFDRAVFVASDEGTLLALDEDGGIPLWRGLANSTFSTNGAFVSDLSADDYGVYAANTDTKLYCLDRRSGRIKWQYFSGAALKTAPAVTAKTVYQYVLGKGIVAIDKENSGFAQPRWNVADAVQFLAEDDAHAYLRRDDNTLLAVNKTTGKLLFTSAKHNFNRFITNTTDGLIFAAAPSGEVVAIRPVLSAGQAGELVLRLEPVQLAMR